ncbi:MAG: O-antigen ligase family protein [Negativicoccus succinicivorans]|nr:O-antigen ligase family protein [Negativicoccus succinicivorans]
MSAVGSVMTSEVDQPRAAAAPSTAGMWLGGVAALLVMRLPMSFLLLLVVPWIILLAQTRYRSGLRAGPLAALEVCCMVTAVIAVVFHPSLLTSIGNSAVIMLAVVGFTLAVFRSADPSKTARQSLSGLYWGALLVWFIGLGEILTGIKLLPLLYPEANTVSAVSKSRWIVTATYPNYNDYGVVMTMLFTALLAKMWFDPRRGAVKLGRLFALVTCFGMILMGGSRGALLGCMCAVALLVILNVRRLHAAAMGVRAFFWGTTLVVAAGGGLWMSPYVQDHSTAERGRIMTNAVSMLMSDPIALLFGYGSLSEYQNEANARFGDVLMDPHNLLLELVLRYGIVAMILFVACWLWIAVKGFLPRRPAVDWQAAFALTVVMLLPVLGIVPSSTLRYHVTWLYLVVASCLTAQMIASRRSELGTMVAHQERVDVTPDQSG